MGIERPIKKATFLRDMMGGKRQAGDRAKIT